MALIYAAAVAGAALFCASLVLLQKKSAPPQAGALAVLREAPVTVIFAPFLLAVAILLVVARQMDVSVGGAGESAVWMTAALVLLCAAGSGYILLFTYVRRAVACLPRQAGAAKRAGQNAQRALAGYYRGENRCHLQTRHAAHGKGDGERERRPQALPCLCAAAVQPCACPCGQRHAGPASAKAELKAVPKAADHGKRWHK